MRFLIDNSLTISLGIVFLVSLFHICIIVKIIPYSITWGGRLSSDKEMYVFESFSLFINLFFGWLLLMKGDFVKFKFSTDIIDAILWILFTVFVINTISNLFAKTNFEKFFALLTGLLAVLIWCVLKY